MRIFGTIADAVVRRRGVVLLGWVIAALALNVFVPQLERVIAHSDVSFTPDSAPSIRAVSEMDERFGGNGARSVVFVVLADDGGLSGQDRAFYRDLVGRLRDQPGVMSLQETVSQPELADALWSEDGKATYVPVGLSGGNGSPETTAQIASLRDAAEHGSPPGLSTHVTGQIATVADLQTGIEDSLVVITAMTVGLILLILLVIYRSMSTALIVLGVIGLSLGTARALTALCGLAVFEVSTFTSSLMTATVLGAGTDYGVFLVSRFHENMRRGLDPRSAVVNAAGRVGGVISASAVTVVAACSAMALAEVSLYSTTGPAIAVSLVVTLAAGLTLLPAVLSLAAERGLALPRAGGSDRRWRRMSLLAVRRPARVLLAGLVLLGLLAAWYPVGALSFDERAMQPASTDSNLGYRALAGHFPEAELMPEYVLVTADHDMRNPRDLAALESAARDVSEVDGVRAVRGVTRPTGRPLEEASLGRQAGQVGARLGVAADRLERSDPSGLTRGSARLAEGSDELADGAGTAIAGAQRLLGGLNAADAGAGELAGGADRARDGSARLAEGAAQLADGLELAAQQAELAVGGLETAHGALRDDPLCDVDPVCARAREGIGEIYRAERDQLVPGLHQAADAARQLASGGARLESGAERLAEGIARVRSGIDRLAEGQRMMRDRLGELADGANRLGDGAARLRDGSEVMAGSMRELQRGLDQAASYLRTAGGAATAPEVGGFYLPASAWQDPRMALASGMFLSEDGRTARLLVLHGTDPFDRPAMDRMGEVYDTAHRALEGTSLQRAEVSGTGTASVLRDLQRLSDADFERFAVAALLAVLVILMLLLRSVVAPLYLLMSVVLSYAAAMGLSVLVWQELLGIRLEWTVPAISFVILVAVGADYNMLLMSRMREEAGAGVRLGIARATAKTGGVITTAGIIFAVSMFALMSGSVTTLAQIGFTIGAGLLLDTFVVRTLVVPSTAALLGARSWWPSRG